MFFEGSCRAYALHLEHDLQAYGSPSWYDTDIKRVLLGLSFSTRQCADSIFKFLNGARIKSTPDRGLIVKRIRQRFYNGT